ncbi:tetratricopeptide repeat protein [Fulvivirga sp. 29W222]|uniref:Tetratricopeptide repeat protein n=1 Tax=Fulvivirga marina TaxID=2494733 RepID=A0A937KEF2_9BACT|nr:tetratricopeptide repeat protein [Fulvivirga marina]MBL6447065.1 tetratricopeptide repeat protein [Fulvivirga marina]
MINNIKLRGITCILKLFIFSSCLLGSTLPFCAYSQQSPSETNSDRAKKQGIQHLIRRKYQSADSAFIECISLSQKEKNYKNEGKCKSNLASSYVSQYKLSDALPLYLEAINTYEEHGFDTLYGEALLNLGWTYRNLDIYDSAMVNLHKGITVLEKLDHKKALMKGYNFLATTIRKSGAKSPEYYFNKSLSLAEEFKDTAHISTVYNNLGNFYRDKGALDSAIYYFKQSLQLKTAPNKLAITYLNLAQAYMDKGLFDQAEEALLTSYHLRREHGSSSSLFKSYLELVNLYHIKQKNDEAQYYMHQADSLAQTLSLVPSIKLEYLELKQEELRRQENYAGALALNDQILSLRDSLYNEEKQNLATRYEALFSVSKWKNAFELEAVKRQQEAATYQQNKITTRWIILVFIMLLIGALLFAKLRNTKAKVATAEAELHAQKAETERIKYQELNHRTSNLLTIFSSLITIQENDPENKENMAISKIRSQADAITSVYHLLGNTSKSAGKWINMADYIHELAHNLCSLSTLDSSQYTITGELEPIRIPEHQCNPFALIINEVITNAIKYGKDENDHLTLDMKLMKTDDEVIIFNLKDGGKGFSENISKKGEGNTLINLLSKQLRATIEYGLDGSSEFEMSFKRKGEPKPTLL